MFSFPQLPLVAAINLDDIIKIIIFGGGALIWIASQVVAAMKKQEQAAKPPPAHARPQPAAKPRPKPADSLSDEIDKFLRRMTQDGGEEAAEVEVLEPAEPARPAPQQRPLAAPVPVEVVDVKPLHEPLTEELVEHVQQHIGASSFDEEVASLGQVTGHADERLESRLHHKFDHRVGSLADDQITQVADSINEQEYQDFHDMPTAADKRQLAQAVSASQVSPVSEIFGSPESIRRAIIINEIFRRPEDRWE